MVATGMRVLSREGEHVGYVADIIDGHSARPPGLVVTVSHLFGLRQRSVALTTFDVRDVRDGAVILRISRWDAKNRCDRAPALAAGAPIAPAASAGA